MEMSWRRRALQLFACLAAVGSLPAHADQYPSHPIRMIVAFGPGSGIDVGARIVAEQLSKQLNVGVVVENHDGAGGLIGTMLVAKAPADGYTLLMASSPVTVTQMLQPVATYDPVKDFTAVTRVSLHPLVLITGNDTPYKTFGELIAYIKAHPGKLNYATSGKGSSSHLEFELIKQRYGLDIPDVPYKTFSTAMTDTIAGRASFYLSAYSAALPHIKSGSVRALAISSQKRSDLLPDVPTLAEVMGVPNYEASVSYGVLAPAGTPAPVVQRLNAEIGKALQNESVRERIRNIGGEVAMAPSAEYGEMIRTETAKWDELVQSIGLKVLK